MTQWMKKLVRTTALCSVLLSSVGAEAVRLPHEDVAEALDNVCNQTLPAQTLWDALHNSVENVEIDEGIDWERGREQIAQWEGAERVVAQKAIETVQNALRCYQDIPAEELGDDPLAFYRDVLSKLVFNLRLPLNRLLALDSETSRSSGDRYVEWSGWNFLSYAACAHEDWHRGLLQPTVEALMSLGRRMQARMEGKEEKPQDMGPAGPAAAAAAVPAAIEPVVEDDPRIHPKPLATNTSEKLERATRLIDDAMAAAGWGAGEKVMNLVGSLRILYPMLDQLVPEVLALYGMEMPTVLNRVQLTTWVHDVLQQAPEASLLKDCNPVRTPGGIHTVERHHHVTDQLEGQRTPKNEFYKAVTLAKVVAERFAGHEGVPMLVYQVLQHVAEQNEKCGSGALVRAALINDSVVNFLVERVKEGYALPRA